MRWSAADRDGPAAYAGRIGSAIALARSGELVQAENLLADVLQRRGRFQKSVEWYTRRELASVLSRQGKFDEATSEFAKIFSEQERGPDAPGGAAIEILIERAAHHRRMKNYENAATDARLARQLAAEGLPAVNWIIAMADAETGPCADPAGAVRTVGIVIAGCSSPTAGNLRCK